MATTSKLPEPQTKTALLPSFGYGPGSTKITRHIYSRSVECTIPGNPEAGTVTGPGVEFLFRCSVTNAERRWGVAEVEVAKVETVLS